LENWVEKYIPLQVQYRIVQGLEGVVDNEKKLKLYERNKVITEQLRNEVLKD
jgi:hypothetical protein